MRKKSVLVVVLVVMLLALMLPTLALAAHHGSSADFVEVQCEWQEEGDTYLVPQQLADRLVAGEYCWYP